MKKVMCLLISFYLAYALAFSVQAYVYSINQLSGDGRYAEIGNNGHVVWEAHDGHDYVRLTPKVVHPNLVFIVLPGITISYILSP